MMRHGVGRCGRQHDPVSIRGVAFCSGPCYRRSGKLVGSAITARRPRRPCPSAAKERTRRLGRSPRSTRPQPPQSGAGEDVEDGIGSVVQFVGANVYAPPQAGAGASRISLRLRNALTVIEVARAPRRVFQYSYSSRDRGCFIVSCWAACGTRMRPIVSKQHGHPRRRRGRRPTSRDHAHLLCACRSFPSPTSDISVRLHIGSTFCRILSRSAASGCGCNLGPLRARAPRYQFWHRTACRFDPCIRHPLHPCSSLQPRQFLPALCLREKFC
jgi:hypothetical protein